MPPRDDRPLSAPPPVPRSVIIRPLLPADLTFAQSLVGIAGWNQTEQDWRGYLAYEPDGCWLAELEGRPAGTATSVGYDEAIGWIGMVLVHPEYRRRGVGTALLDHAIAYLRQRRVAVIKLDATPAGKPVYRPRGFRDEYELARHEGVAPARVTPAGGHVSVLRPEAAASVAEWDRGVFGADRTRVLDSLLRREPSWAFVSRRNSTPIGYLIARAGRNAVQVGPWTAEDPGVAEDLLLALFAAVPGRRVFVDVPEPNSAGRQLLARHGFGVQRPFTRMHLGELPAAGRPTWIYGTAGAEKG